MESHNQRGLGPEYAAYYRMIQEYRSGVAECHESLERLRRMERSMRELAVSLPIEQRLNVAAEIETGLKRLNGDAAAIDNLSARELEVFGLIGDGLATHEIASRLGLANSTVEPIASA